MSVPEICLLGIRVASALHHIHTNSVLHLDVKPDNVTMGESPTLLDLSLARTIAGPMTLRHTLGTAPYLAPEQCVHGVVTGQTEIFGLGATALSMIVMSCLHRDPQRRPRTAIDVTVALHGVLEGFALKELFAWPKGLRVRL